LVRGSSGRRLPRDLDDGSLSGLTDRAPYLFTPLARLILSGGYLQKGITVHMVNAERLVRQKGLPPMFGR
jgi:hypothetical protein